MDMLGSWDTFESSLDSDDTKYIVGCGGKSSLYDVRTIGIISPREPVLQKPAISIAQAGNNDIVVAADGFLTAFGDGDKFHEATINLESRIDALCFRPDGEMVIAGDYFGVIHLISLSSMKIIFSHKVADSEITIDNEEPTFEEKKSAPKVFCSVTCCEDQKNGNGMYFIGVGLTTPKFIVFSNVNLLALQKAHKSDDLQLLRSTQLAMSMKEYDALSVHVSKITNMLSMSDGFIQRYLTTGDGVLGLWSEDVNPFVQEPSASDFVLESQTHASWNYTGNEAEISKAFHLFKYIYTLDTKGSICQWSSQTLVLLQYWENTKVKDFTITDSGLADSGNSTKLYAIIANDLTDEMEICVFQLPSMTRFFSCKCTGQSLCAIACGPSFLEDIVYVDGEISGASSWLKLHRVSEAAAEDRFLRLLIKRCFDEAEQFAQLYNLDTQQVHLQKALHLASLILELYDDKASMTSTFKELMNCLEKLTNDTAVAEICLETIIPDVHMNYALLALGRTRLGKPAHVQNGDLTLTGREMSGDENDLLLQIINRMDRLVTFRVAHGYSQENGADWVRFCHADLPTELARLLASGNISASATVLLRHKASLLAFLKSPGQTDSDSSATEERLQLFLNHIPDTADVDSVVRWLEDSLLPTLLPRIACSLKVLASWLHTRAESYENSAPSNWPENGIKMANVLFNFQNNIPGLGSMRDQLSATSRAFKTTSVEVARLRLLTSRLQLLLQLKQKYRCNVTLAEFIQETTMSLTYRMLDRVMVPELVSSVLRTMVRPYMREHCLSEEDVLLGYIEDLLSRFRDQSWGSVESLRERKIVAIIQCITRQQVFLQATVKLAKRASVPWSDDVHSLVNKGIEIAESNNEQDGSGDSETNLETRAKQTHFLKELEYCKHIEQLPTVLAEYGLTNVNMRSKASQEQVVRFLIHQGTKEALDQACHFCHTFTTIPTIDLYRFRLIYLLQSRQAGECLNLLLEAESEDPALGMSLTRHTVGLAELYLRDSADIEERQTHCSVAISMIEHIIGKESQIENDDYELRYYLCENLELLRNVTALQVQCGESVSVDEYRDKKFRGELLSRKVKQYSSSGAVETDFEMTKDSSSDFSSTLAFASGHSDPSACTNATRLQSDSLNSSGGKVVKKSDATMSLSHVLNVARILQVPSDKLRSDIALAAVKSGETGILTAAHLCSEMLQIYPTEDAADISFQVVTEALKRMNDTPASAMNLYSRVLRIAVEAIMYCKPDKITQGMEMCKFYALCKELIKITDTEEGIFRPQDILTTKDPYANITTLHPRFEDCGGLMLRPKQVLPIFAKIIGVLFLNGDILGATSSIQDMEHIGGSALPNLGQLPFEMTSILQGARQSQLALIWMLSCISTSLRCMANQCDPLSKDISSVMIKHMLSTVEDLNKVLPDYVNDCIKTLLCSKSVDVSLVIGLLTLLPLSQAQQLLQSELNKAGSNSKHVMCVASAGIATLRLNSMEAEVGKFEHLFLNARWGELLRPLQIPFDQAHFASNSSKSSILSKLVHHPEVTGQLIRDFCLDYDLDVTSALLDLTRALLSDPTCLVATHGERKFSEGAGALMTMESLRVPRVDMRMVAWENSKPESQTEKLGRELDPTRPWPCIKKEMAFIMSKIKEKKELSQQLIKILRSETSPYFYKRGKYILNLIAECNVVQNDVNVEKGIELIECLNLLKRSSPVSEYERQNWNFATDTRSSHKLPEISNHRLPLHPLLFGDSSSAWKILTPELNERNTAKLAPIARILSLSIDKLYITAADNFIRSHMDKDDDHQLSLSIDQLKHARALTQEVGDYRMATALAKRIAELLPISEQKVQAYEWCTQLAAKWRSSVSEDDAGYTAVVSTHRSLRGFYHSAAVELVLHKHGLLRENVMMLTSSPEKLILVLYQHPSIVKRYYKPDVESYPDIHEAANAIAEIHSLNIFKLRMNISLEWLISVSTDQGQSDEEDSTVNLANMRAKSIMDSDSQVAHSMNSDLIRLLYVLSHMATKQTARFLLGFAFDRKNPRVTNACRVRALQCVFQLFDDDLVGELTRKNVSTIREKFRLLVFLSELESIGFPISGAQLQGSKKDEVARSIFVHSKFRHDPRAICVAAELCREYDSWCPNTWQALLQQLVALRQISYLSQLLPDICCHASISSLPCLPTVWQSCVTFPLTAMTPPLSSEKVKVAIASYQFLLACPVLLQMHLIGIAQHFCSIGLPFLALGCLLADPSQDENSRKLAIVNYDAIEEQLAKYPLVFGHKQIAEVLQSCKKH